MIQLNYHHLRYFWVIAQEGNITRAARILRLNQSTLSGQLLALEDQLGHALLHRSRRKGLTLTEAGRVVFEYAQTIFTAGRELVDHLENRPIERSSQLVRIGALGSLSKNLQIEFISPLVRDPEVRLLVVTGAIEELLRQLNNHALDLILSNAPVLAEDAEGVFNHLVSEMPVYLVGLKTWKPANLKRALEEYPLVLPPRSSRLRTEFDAIVESMGIRPRIRAEIEDMALLRLLALSGEALVLAPEIVVRNELKSGQLRRVARIPRLVDRFYLISPDRKFPDPKIARMVSRFLVKMRR